MECQRWPEKPLINIGEVWNPVCCHGNKTVELISWSTFTNNRILIISDTNWLTSFFIIFDQNLVECMMSSIGYFAYFKNLNISGTKYLKIVNSIFLLTQIFF